MFLADTAASALRDEPVPTESGQIAGTVEKGLRVFRGIPYAAPPVGALRWQAPQPAPRWEGILRAHRFGQRPVQWIRYEDMVFRDEGPGEDCLTLNVWTPAAAASARLPVMIWIYGGGFQGGGSSEARHDGGNLAGKGVVVVSFNYRLGVLGFLAHPDLTRESLHGASGNYGLLDQAAALAWVRRNIAAFGGDPERITVFGESAGSFSVSALLASPLSRGDVHGAIGQSGAFFRGVFGAVTLAEAERRGLAYAAELGAGSLAELRAKSAGELLEVARRHRLPSSIPIVDGYYLPRPVPEIYAAGEQARVPLLAGWNADEHSVPAASPATAASFAAAARENYGAASETFLSLYPAATDAEARASSAAFEGDRFIAFATWKWLDAQAHTGGGWPVYRYRFDRVLPLPGETPSRGAYHAGEIEYAFDNLGSKEDCPLTESDYHLAAQVSSYWTNFAKTGDPNGDSLPVWPVYNAKVGWPVLHLDTEVRAAPDGLRHRYLFLDAHGLGKPRS